MKYPMKASAITAIIFLALTGCSGESGNSSPTATSSASASATSTSTSSGQTLTTSITELGEIIVGQDGKTVYFFTKDEKDSGKSACVDTCLENWPPVIADGEPTVSEDITATVGTIDIPNGQKQVTVDGMPVYYWHEDNNPGEVKGQGVGNVWYAVSPDGTMINKSAPSSTSSSTASPSSSATNIATDSASDMATPSVTVSPNN